MSNKTRDERTEAVYAVHERRNSDNVQGFAILHSFMPSLGFVHGGMELSSGRCSVRKRTNEARGKGRMVPTYLYVPM